MQRYHRTTALIDAFQGEILAAIEKEPKIASKWQAFCETRREIDASRDELSKQAYIVPLHWWCPSGWEAYYDKEEKRGEIYQRISHLVHRLHLLANAVVPFEALEINIALTLYDLKLISSPEAYSKAEQGLGDYVGGAGNLPSRPPVDEDLIRYRVLAVINETRRQTLALSQLEVLRDSVTRELLVGSSRLIIPLAIILVVVVTVALRWETEFQFATGILLACIGGVVGSFLSAIVRVGKMLDNQDTGRTLILIAGANRSMYFTPMIGCLGALIAFVLVFHGAIPMFDDFDLGALADPKKCDEAPLENPHERGLVAPPRFLLGSLAFGILAGFSERLVHDLVDRFNKPPGKTP